MCPPQKWAETTNILNCYFSKKKSLCHIRQNMYIWKTSFSSLKQYLFGLLFSRNTKKTHIDQIILQTFVLCLKWNASQTFTSGSCNIIDTTCFDECFLFHVMTGRHFLKISLPRGLLEPPCYWVLCNKCFERSPILYP